MHESGVNFVYGEIFDSRFDNVSLDFHLSTRGLQEHPVVQAFFLIFRPLISAE